MHPRGRGIMQDGRSLSKFSAHHADGHGSCERLVERAAAGDRLAMEILYARHHVRVYRFALRFVNDAAAAEDLTSEVFLEVWKHAGRFEGRSQVSTWLLSIARYKAYFLHLAAAGAVLPAMPRLARAQTYPTRPVHLIVGW